MVGPFLLGSAAAPLSARLSWCPSWGLDGWPVERRCEPPDGRVGRACSNEGECAGRGLRLGNLSARSERPARNQGRRPPCQRRTGPMGRRFGWTWCAELMEDVLGWDKALSRRGQMRRPAGPALARSCNSFHGFFATKEKLSLKIYWRNPI